MQLDAALLSVVIAYFPPSRRASASRPMFRTHRITCRLGDQSTAIIRPWTQVRYAAGRQAGRRAGVNSHWTPEKLALSNRYPLSTEMSQLIHPTLLQEAQKKSKGKSPKQLPRQRVVGVSATLKTASNVHVRSQIVSPDLCGMSSPRVLHGPVLMLHCR
jgi:hypothetical protein